MGSGGDWMSARSAFQRYMQNKQKNLDPGFSPDMSGMQELPPAPVVSMPSEESMQGAFGAQMPTQHKPMTMRRPQMPASSGDPTASAVPNAVPNITNRIDLVRWLLANKNQGPSEVGNVIPSDQRKNMTMFPAIPSASGQGKGGLNNAIVSMIAKNLVG